MDNFQEDLYTDEQFETQDEGEYTQQQPPQSPPKPPAYEIKSLTHSIRLLESIRLDVDGLIARYSTKLKSYQQPTQAKRPAVGKKTKPKLYINKEFFADQFKKFFVIDMMEAGDLENYLKVFFHESRLRTDIAPSAIAVTDEEFSIYQKAIADKLDGYYITDKDIPLLIRRMYKPAGVCSITTEDGQTISLDAASFVGASRHAILEILESNRLISYDLSDSVTNFVISRKLPLLLDQIPILKSFKLIETMKDYQDFDSFLKLIDLIRDKNEIYKSLVNTEVSQNIVKTLDLPNIDGFYKPEYVAVLIKKQKTTLKKDDFFKDINKVINSLSVVPQSNNLLD